MSIEGTGTAATTDANGTFQIETAPGNIRVVITGEGFLRRRTTIDARTDRAAVEIDVIRTTPPFDLTFYRELVRNGKDNVANWLAYPIQRWTIDRVDVRFIRRTMDRNELVSDAVLDAMVREARDAMPKWSGGRVNLGQVESTEDRTFIAAPGSIRVQIFSGKISYPGDPDGVCGTGGRPVNANSLVGQIQISLECPIRNGAINLENLQFLFRHELGHAMGFFHTNGGGAGLVGALGGAICTAAGEPRFRDFPVCVGNGQISDTERMHAAIAYSRQWGNIDADDDAATITPLGVNPATTWFDPLPPYCPFPSLLTSSHSAAPSLGSLFRF